MRSLAYRSGAAKATEIGTQTALAQLRKAERALAAHLERSSYWPDAFRCGAPAYLKRRIEAARAEYNAAIEREVHCFIALSGQSRYTIGLLTLVG